MNRERGKQQLGARRNRSGAPRGLILILALLSLGQRAGAQGVSRAVEPANLRITLRTYNYGISRGLLARAEGEATAILSQAGVEVLWIDCPLRPAESEDYPACKGSIGPADFSVKILTSGEARQFSSHREALGQALECPRNQVGCSAYIFYRDVLELAREGDAAEYQLLGHALAHEIGHLLLGSNSHSAAGIMRGHWNDHDLEVIARARLLFTDEQSKRMRSEVSARNTNPREQLEIAGKVRRGGRRGGTGAEAGGASVVRRTDRNFHRVS